MKYISLGEVGIADWVAVVFAWFAEVPSGVLADKFGRRRLVVLAMLLSGLGIGLQGLAFDWQTFLITNVIYLVGFSFYSGAAEALAYESLRELPNQDKAYEHVVSTSRTVELCASFISVIVGTYLYQLSPSLPFFVQGVCFCLGGVICCFATETVNRTQPRTRSTTSSPLGVMLSSFRVMDRKLFPVVIICFSALGLYDMIGWSFLRTAMSSKFGYDEVGYASIINIGLLSTILVTRILPSIRASLGDRIGFTGFAFILGLLVFVCALNLGYPGALLIIAIMMVGNFLRPWLSILANESASDSYRATLISLFSFITRIQFLLLGAVLPYLAQKGFLDKILLVLGAFTMICALVSRRVWKMQSNIVPDGIPSREGLC